MTVVTYAGGREEMRIPDGEARLCALYRDPETSEVSEESYILGEVLAHDPSGGAAVICNGSTLATSNTGSAWTITPAGQERLAWEASLLKERWSPRGLRALIEKWKKEKTSYDALSFAEELEQVLDEIVPA